ncbi:hypothetical protein EVAR_92876_1 [Eumeta japonica]|uniref:Uncharacterized protein n=1 Tax=Eumeta variegata TaxID=151549 RepID=A0A4C1TDH0_EUMVA|nr:hypothetical protein EVAR_92876_1 [Eumeta japonica]
MSWLGGFSGFARYPVSCEQTVSGRRPHSGAIRVGMFACAPAAEEDEGSRPRHLEAARGSHANLDHAALLSIVDSFFRVRQIPRAGARSRPHPKFRRGVNKLFVFIVFPDVRALRSGYRTARGSRRRFR